MDVVTEGVYFLYDDDELVYIGESDNLFRRIGQHIAEKIKKFNRFEIYPTESRKELEGFLIRMLKPKYNISDGKWFGHSYISDLFPNMTIMETINKYEEKYKDLTINEIAESIGIDKIHFLRVLIRMNAPIYKIDGIWRIDRNYYREHQTQIYKNL